MRTPDHTHLAGGRDSPMRHEGGEGGGVTAVPTVGALGTAVNFLGGCRGVRLLGQLCTALLAVGTVVPEARTHLHLSPCGVKALGTEDGVGRGLLRPCAEGELRSQLQVQTLWGVAARWVHSAAGPRRRGWQGGRGQGRRGSMSSSESHQIQSRLGSDAADLCSSTNLFFPKNTDLISGGRRSGHVTPKHVTLLP